MLGFQSVTYGCTATQRHCTELAFCFAPIHDERNYSTQETLKPPKPDPLLPGMLYSSVKIVIMSAC